MAHKRSIIRNALKEILKGAGPYNTAAEDRVFTNRAYNKNKLPAIVIYDESESAIPRDIRATPSIRTMTCKIELSIEANSDYDTVLDDLALEVETLISNSGTLNGTASSVTYTNTELAFDHGGAKAQGQAILTYEIKYIT